MARVGRWLWITLALLFVATAAAAAIPRFGFAFLPPHVARVSAAVLDDGLTKAIDASLAKTPPGTVETAVDFSLAVSGKLLHFEIGHPVSLQFAAVDREGNCIEYAHLFAKVFDRAAKKGGLRARAYVVHSGSARVFGEKLPFKGWDDHDWVLVVDRTSDRGDVKRWYIDPTLDDAHLGWDISSNVQGEIKLP